MLKTHPENYRKFRITGKLIHFVSIFWGRLDRITGKSIHVSGVKRSFQCIEFCESRDARLPTHEETHLVEKFKLQNQEMILNLTEQENYRMSRYDCKGDPYSTIPINIRLSPFLKRLFYFVGVRIGSLVLTWWRPDVTAYQILTKSHGQPVKDMISKLENGSKIKPTMKFHLITGNIITTLISLQTTL